MLILGSGLQTKAVGKTQIYSSGFSNYFSLGINVDASRSSPTAVTFADPLPGSRSWTTIQGFQATAALNSIGELYIFGDNNFGIWGDSLNEYDFGVQPTTAWTTATRSSPTLVGASTQYTSWKTFVSGGVDGYWAEDYGAQASASGKQFFVGIKVNTGETYGSLWTWGGNTIGQLGKADTIFRSSPSQVGSSTDWIKVAAAGDHAIALDRFGTVHAWGRNAERQLGQTDTIARSNPVIAPGWSAVAGLANGGGDVYASPGRSFIRDSSGYMWWAGLDLYYPGGTNSATTAFRSMTVGVSQARFNSFAPGAQHALGVQTNGTLVAVGRNQRGQLGISNTLSRSSFVQVGSGTDWSSVSASSQHSLALKTNGDLYAWGWNIYGQLGTGDQIDRSSPTLVATGVSKIMAADYNSLILKTDGTLWSAGSNAQDDGSGSGYVSAGPGGVGDFTWIDRSSFVQVGSGLSSELWPDVTSSGSFSGVKHYIKNGSVYAWGRAKNGTGAAGISGGYLWELRYYHKFANTSWNAVAMGQTHALGIQSDGTLWSWGYASNGGLGLNSSVSSRSKPVKVSNDTFHRVYAGGSISIGLQNQGSYYKLFMWGANSFGELGLNNTISRSSPTQVGANKSWTAVYTNGASVHGITADGLLWGWGYNAAGQLGLNDTIYRSSPTLIGTGYAGAKISNSFGHTVIVKSDGSLWVTGDSTYGQLGVLPVGGRSSFVQVGSSSWTMASAGNAHTAAIDVAGRLFTWGRNNVGQLMGLAPTVYTTMTSPVQVGTKNSWKLVEAGKSSATFAVLESF